MGSLGCLDLLKEKLVWEMGLLKGFLLRGCVFLKTLLQKFVQFREFLGVFAVS